MTSLEWINEQIRECKQIIQQVNIKIDEDKKYPSLVKSHKERIEELRPILKHLRQILTELEAWEELQKYLTLDEEYSPFYKTTYKFLTLKNDCIDESNSYEEKESLTIIKKALEVKDVD